MPRLRKRSRVGRWLAKLGNIPRFFGTYTQWHTGLEPSVQIVKFITRAKKIRKQASFQVRKLAKFTQWHFVAAVGTVNINAIRFKTRITKVQKKKSFRLRKLVRFNQWHTGLSLTTFNQNVLKLKTRKRQKKVRAVRPRLLYRTFKTGIQQNIPALVTLKIRRRKTQVVSKKKRLARFGINYHTGLHPIAPTGSTWVGVSLRSNTRRGGY